MVGAATQQVGLIVAILRVDNIVGDQSVAFLTENDVIGSPRKLLEGRAISSFSSPAQLSVGSTGLAGGLRADHPRTQITAGNLAWLQDHQ
jgi:hypothetical protein